LLVIGLVEFDLSLPRSGQNVIWLPKVLVQALGRDLKLMPNSVAAVLYGADADLGDVVRSLEIIKQDLQLKASRQVASK
jgi:hypothetical protein